MVFFNWRGAFFALTSAVLLSASAAAQNATFPEAGKDITFICISAAGGPTDAATRVLAESVSKALGKQIIVDVKAGANGAIGLGALVRSEPDGHTLAIGGYSVATTTWLRPDSQVTFDGDDFEPIATFMSDPVILAVPASSPYQNLADFVAAAKAKPKAIRAGTTGYLGTSAFVGMLLEDAAEISLTLVPFTGSAGTVAALAGN